MQELYTLSAVLIVLLAGLIYNAVSPAILFTLASFFCYLVGIGSFESLVSSFGNNGLLILTLLLLCGIALEKTPMLTVMTKIIGKASLPITIAKLGFSSAVLSSFISNTAVVASMISAIKRSDSHPASKLLLPLSYASILGGTLTLIGTSTNLIVNAFIVDAGLTPLGFFEFTNIGIVVVLVGILLLICLSFLLPSSQQNKDEQTQMYLFEAKIADDSPLIEQTIKEAGFHKLKQVYLVELERNDVKLKPTSLNRKLQAGDLLRFSGTIDSINILQDFKGLEWFDEHQIKGKSILEAVIAPSSRLINNTLRNISFREQFDAVVMGVRRGHTKLTGSISDIILHPGDVLLLAPDDDFGNKGNLATEFASISGLDLSVRISPIKSFVSLSGFFVAITLNLLEIIPLAKSLLILLLVNIFMKTITLREIRRRFPLELVVVVGCALYLANLMLQTGLADIMAMFVLELFQGYGVYGAFIAIYLMTLLLTELITNNASAALAFPIALTVATNFGVDVRPFIMAIIFGASASFISPYGYQTNLMVFSAGDYKIKDYLKLGIPMSIIYSLIVIFLIPILFPFQPQ